MGADRTREIEARVNAATPGPWWSSEVGATGGATVRTEDGNRPIGRLVPDDRDALDLPGLEGDRRAGRAIRATRMDATFIAHAREDVPWLLARVRELEAAIRGYSVAIFRAPNNRDEDEVTAAAERLVAALSGGSPANEEGER